MTERLEQGHRAFTAYTVERELGSGGMATVYLAHDAISILHAEVSGRVVQEILYAAYASAGLGRKITLPFRPRGIAKPIHLWKKPELAQAAL